MVYVFVAPTPVAQTGYPTRRWSFGERVVMGIIAAPAFVVAGAVAGAAMVVAVVVAVPLMGCVCGLDAAHDAHVARKHRARLKSDWRYRLRHTAVRMNTLKKWQDFMSADSSVRAAIMLAEAGDVPFELWHELAESSDFFATQIRRVGTPEYAREEAVRAAVGHFARKYAAAKGTSEAAAWAELRDLAADRGLPLFAPNELVAGSAAHGVHLL